MRKSKKTRLNLLLGKRIFLARLLDVAANEERTAQKNWSY